jgi:peroxin-4
MSPPGGRRVASPLKRLHAELSALQASLKTQTGASSTSPIERLEPKDQDDLFRWEAVVVGRGLGGGYDDGRWKLDIEVPETYPNAPPRVRFVTKTVASNVNFEVSEDWTALQGAYAHDSRIDW